MKKVNIIIPSIKPNDELLKSLKEINKLNYSNFFVTVVLDHGAKNKLPKFKYKINKMVVGKINMSKKRNLAAKKFKTKYIAFIDSDAYPNVNWLKNAIKHLSDEKIHIVGGPNIPFKNKSYSEQISHYCKRSFFVTAHYNFINYKSKNRYCKFLHSSNFIISRNLYNSVNGMNENLYIGEDHDFFYRLNEKFNKIKIYFDKSIFVFHEDREFKFFLMQRFCYGLNVLTSKNTGSKRFLALLPFFLIWIIFILLFNFFKLSLIIFLLFFVLLSSIIYTEIRKYLNKFQTKLLVVIFVYLSNLFLKYLDIFLNHFLFDLYLLIHLNYILLKSLS